MKSHFWKLLITINLSVCTLAPSNADAFFTSVKAMGRAGAVGAQPLDTLSAAYNPAASAWVGDRWDLGGHWVKEIGRTEVSGSRIDNGRYNSHDSWSNLLIPEFGVNAFTCEELFTWGFMVYNRTFFKTTYKSVNDIFGTSKPGLEYLHYVAAPTGSIRFGCDHALGVTLDLHGQRLKVNGLENFDNEEFSRKPGRVTNEGYEYSGGIGVTIGWLSRFSDCVTIGLAWSPEVHMSHFRDYKGLVARKGRLDIPARFMGALAIEMLNGVTVEFDVEHIKYNHISALDHPLMPNLEEVNRPFGSKRGPGLGWRDQTVFRLGAEWEINETSSVRMGWWHARTPIKSSETLANSLVPYIIEDYLFWGGSWMCGCIDEFSFYGGYGFQNKVRGRDSIPDLLGGGEVDLKEEKWMAGLSWGRKF